VDTSASPAVIDVARQWLEAMRKGNDATLAELSGYPMRIEGLSVATGPDAVACRNRPRADGLGEGRSFDAGGDFSLEIPERQKLTEKVGCLWKDTFLRDYTPVLREGRWPADRKDSRDGIVGTIGVVKANQVSKRLKKYRKQAASLAKAHTLVQARMTDNNGVTNFALLALRADEAGNPKVYAVLVDERFEE
jgi:hypothetical protein